MAAAIDAELARQQDTLEMIASENSAPVSVLQAQGSVLTNKYAEGYPGRRYYDGCEHVDVIDDAEIFNDKLREWEDYYTYHRPHGGLGGQTPYERLKQKTTTQA